VIHYEPARVPLFRPLYTAFLNGRPFVLALRRLNPRRLDFILDLESVLIRKVILALIFFIDKVKKNLYQRKGKIRGTG
jgi:hypothetical protein